MKYISVCSGIEAATVAWHSLGWKAAAYSEIEPFPSAVLAHHYPDVPNVGDMTKYKEWNIEPGSVDLLVGGTPCQSFSVAGLRKGLADPRGNLALVYCGILDHFKPRWFVWENVPGVLSSGGGRDFGSFLGALAELGYGFAYRVLDAQWFGVAQRRRRVFVVGYLGDWRPAAKVLFEPESLRGNPAPSREAGQTVAPTIAGCANGGGANGPGRDVDSVESLQPYLIANTLPARMHKGVNSTLDEGQTPVIAWDEELNATIEQAGTLLRGGDGGRHDGVLAPTLTASNDPSRSPQSSEITAQVAAVVQATAAVAFSRNDDGRDATNDLAPTMRVAGRAGGMLGVATAMQVRRLTPVECERLQGFPDNYTAIPWRKKTASECPDGPRYKALGNSMAVPVMAWIGKRIQQQEG